MEENGIRVVDMPMNGIRVVGVGGGSGGDGYTKAEADARFALKSETYNKTEVDGKLDLKADKATVYTRTAVDNKVTTLQTDIDTRALKTDVYTKEEVDTSQATQDARIKALEDGGVPPGDTYTKAEIDAQQSAQDAEINKRAIKTEVDTALGLKADKATTYTKTEVDTALGTKANSADVYNKTDIDTKLGTKANTSDLTALTTRVTATETKNTQQDTAITALQNRLTVAPRAIAISKLVDNITTANVNLTFEASPKFYSNSGVFTSNGTAITNTVTTDASNNIIITGSINFKMAGLISAITTITISCPDDLSATPVSRQFTISTESAFAVPFRFVIAGDKATTNINVTYSGLTGLTSRQILPSSIEFTKIK